MKKQAVYPGTFDPVTYGHVDVIRRCAKVFDEIYLGIAESTHKKTLFSSQERYEMACRALEDVKNVRIEIFSGLAVDYVCQKGLVVIIRGLRMMSDFEYEFQMALTNKKLKAEVETLFMMPEEKYAYISSSLIKEAASLGADLHQLVPPYVEEQLKKRLNGGARPGA